MSVYNKENWCRGSECKFHPNPKKFLLFEIKSFKYNILRCLQCKRFVTKENFLK